MHLEMNVNVCRDILGNAGQQSLKREKAAWLNEQMSAGSVENCQKNCNSL